MPKPRGCSKAVRCRNRHVPHDAKAGLRGANPKRDSSEKINDWGAMRIRFRFVLVTKVNGHEELWTI
jgi:hypothetical protein